jgi:hypothetical protein
MPLQLLFPTEKSISSVPLWVQNLKLLMEFLGKLAALASPAFTGTPTAPTAAAGTNTTQLATTAFVQALVKGGSTVCVFSASPLSAAQIITHGLGRTPVSVTATADFFGAGSSVVFVSDITSTTFKLRCYDVDAVARTGNQTVWWIAL